MKTFTTNELRNHIRQNGKYNTVLMVWRNTSLSIKEAKDIVDKVPLQCAKGSFKKLSKPSRVGFKPSQAFVSQFENNFA